MAGHSKWANIKHRKAAQDNKRGKLFSKLIRELTVAARHGGGDPNDNPRLRAAIEKALSANMTRDTIDRAVDRGAGNGEADQVDEISYEGYAPGGVAILVETMTDNRNRTVAEVRHAFTKHGGNLGTDGSVAYLFHKKGNLIFTDVSEDDLIENALEAGAEDVQQNEDGSFTVITEPDVFGQIKDALSAAKLEPVHAEVTMLADNYLDLDDDKAASIVKLVDALEDLDDVQQVYINAHVYRDEG